MPPVFFSPARDQRSQQLLSVLEKQ
jgi:hypothetical protein